MKKLNEFMESDNTLNESEKESPMVRQEFEKTLKELKQLTKKFNGLSIRTRSGKIQLKKLVKSLKDSESKADEVLEKLGGKALGGSRR